MSRQPVVSIPKTIVPAPPVHPLSAFVTIVIDWLWTMVEVGATITVAGLLTILPLIIACGATCFVIVLLVQRYVAGDQWGACIAKGLAMGVAAAVPYAVVGTAAGIALLGWAGIHEIEATARRLLK